jgi:membrane protease YdiL (CAAX protease family)
MKTKKAETELFKKSFRIMWLILPIYICGIAFVFAFIMLEQKLRLRSGEAKLICSIFFTPIALLLYKYCVVKKAEKRVGEPEELKLSFSFLAGGFGLSIAIALTYLLIVMLSGTVVSKLNHDVIYGLVNAAGLALFTSVSEELLMRGVVFRLTEKYRGSLFAILVSSILFGLMHIGVGSSLWTAVFIGIEGGISLAAIYMATRNLWATIGVHAGWNFSLAFFGLSSTGVFATKLLGPAWLIGDHNGKGEPLTLAGLWLVVAGFFIVVAIKKKRFITA